MARILTLLVCLLASRSAAARTIAIAYFDNNTGRAELEPLRKGLADMLITDLGNVGSLQIVERDRLNQVLGELKLSTSKFIDPKTAQRLGKGLAAEYIMTGGYLLAADTLRIDVRVIAVATGKVAASEKVEGKQDEFFSLEKDLVDILIKTLDVKLTTSERGKLRSNATQSFEAWQKYSAGLDAKDHGDDAEARRLFQAALDADPNYRAAKTATDRLKAIFARSDAAKAAEIDRVWKALDPKAPDFAQSVDKLLSELGRDSADELRRKIALLTFLAERDLAPVPPGGFSRIPMEVAALLQTFDTAPDADVLLPPVCEYLLSRFPKDLSTPPRCKLLLELIENQQKVALAQRKQWWDDAAKNAVLPWAVAQVAVRPELTRLFRLYAKKVKRP